MSPLASSSRLGSEFDAFLFAPIGEDQNGLPLSIISLLGRQDFDPWQEAARLAALPTQAAAQTLASLLAALPVQSLKEADPGALAAHLIALLPHPTPTKAQPLLLGPVGATVYPRLLMHAVLFAIWLTWFLSLLIDAPIDRPGHGNTVYAPTPAAVPSQTQRTAIDK